MKPRAVSGRLPSDTREQQRTLDGILLVGAVVLTGMVLSSPWGGGWGPGLAMYGTGVGLHLGHWLWLRLRPSRWVAISHCLLYFVWVTGILALRAGGMGAPAAFVYPPLVVMAGLVWSGRAALGMAALTGAAGALLASLQLRGLLPPASDGATPWRLWLVMTACVTVTAALIRFALGTLARSNEERLSNERRFADLVRASPDVMLFVDASGTLRGSNPALQQRYGIEPARVEGQQLAALALFEADALAAVCQQVAATFEAGQPRCQEHVARDGGGAAQLVEVHSYRVDGRDRDALVCLSVRDLSEREQRRKLEQRLLEGQRLEALGRLAGGVAHDFNNLLMVILGSSEVLKRSQPHVRSELVAIEDAAKRAAQLTGQLLAFGRRQVLVAEAVELNRAIQQLLPLLERLLHAEIRLQVRAASEDCLAAVDRSQLDQILINLLVNARDAMPNGGTVVVECGRGLPRSSNGVGEGWVWFSVSDTGVGITPELRERIFEPFFTTKAGQGTGLGLSTVHGIVTQSGGSIEVESEPGRGTTFFVALPRATRADQVAERLSSEPPRPRSARILVVDDDAPVRKVIAAILESGGHQVVSADCGPAGLRALHEASEPFDLLLTDVVMGGMNGAQLAEQARQGRPELRVLFMSGHTAELLDARGVLQSREQFIAKPFVARELLQRVDELLMTAPLVTPAARELVD